MKTQTPETCADQLSEIEISDSMDAQKISPPMNLKLDGETLTIEMCSTSPELAKRLQMIEFGTKDPAFHKGLLHQIVCLGAYKTPIDSDNSNFVMSVIRSIEPRDELEALLAAQMGAIHSATMMMARKFNHVETIRQQDSAERTLNKLARTFCAQLDALKKYRTGGQQKVTVEHVTVNEGGQAIVGAVNLGKGGGDESNR